MELGKFCVINLWSLDHLYLSDSDIFHWINSINFSGDLLLNYFRGEEIQDLSSSGFRNLPRNYFVHSSSNLLLLGTQCIVGFLLLVARFSSEGNRENTNNIPVSWSTVHDTLNKSLSLLNQSTQLVSGHVYPIEATKSITSSGLINDQTDLSPGKGVLVRGKICLATPDNTPTNTVLNLAWIELNSYGDLESYWHRCSQMTQPGREQGLWVGTILF